MASIFKKNDRVKVTYGDHKGSIGNISKVIGHRVLVTGVNLCTRHTKPTKDDPKGGLVKKEKSLHISNISHCFGEDNQISKVGFKLVDNKKVRYLKVNGQLLDDNEVQA
jgi:large subunit ribosomal protein L24|tara:strand:- start:444 stop:770 length:327 start_codon:yes stop_codon:yes gene_type:complete